MDYLLRYTRDFPLAVVEAKAAYRSALGGPHSKVEMILNIYAHVLPVLQQEAAAKLGTLLHG